MSYASVESVYCGKRVLITGHTGFKGSWLSLWLAQMGAEVIGISLPAATAPNHFELMAADIDSHLLDIRDLDRLKAAVCRARPDMIFHMAAQSLVLPSYDDPLETLSTNVMGTANLFEAIKAVQTVKALVVVTSDKCYQNKEWLWGYRENEPLGGHDPYSASKACQEHVATAYKNAYFPLDKYKKDHELLVATARAGNVIGGGDWADNRLLVDLVKAASEAKPAIIRNSLAVRPWQHVLDCLYGYLKLGAQLLSGDADFSGAWNFAPSHQQASTVGELCEIAKLCWSKISIVDHTSASASQHEAKLLSIDATKALRYLQWQPQLTTKETIEWTIDWYRDYYENSRVTSMTQLKNYHGLLQQAVLCPA